MWPFVCLPITWWLCAGRPKMNEPCRLPTRQRLLEQIEQLARHAIHGTSRRAPALVATRAAAVTLKAPSTDRTPYISYRGERGKTSGYYVPKAAQSEVRRGVEAWSQLQTLLRQLSALNKERALQAARVKK